MRSPREIQSSEASQIRTFETGATRSPAAGKPDYAKYLSPEALRAFGRYMLKHQVQSDGSFRAGNNWKKGIPLDSYMSSMWRHFFDVWEIHECGQDSEDEELMRESLCALLFNVFGYLHEYEKASALGCKPA